MQKTYKVNTLWILVAGLDSSNRNWRPTTNGFLKICTISYNFHAKSSFSSSFPFLKDLEPFQSISTPGNVGISCSQGTSSAKTRSLKPPSSESEAPVQVKSRPRSSHLAKETQTFHFGKFMGKINGKVKYNKYTVYIMWKYMKIKQTNKPKRFEFWVLLHGFWQARRISWSFKLGRKDLRL